MTPLGDYINQTALPGCEEGLNWEEAKTISDLKTVKHKVRFILEKYPSSKGDDVILLFYYYKHFGNGVNFKFKDFKQLLSMTSPESIRRTRQKIQEAGELLPTERTVRKRRRREEIIRGGIKDV
jgi:hypothetical protein